MKSNLCWRKSWNICVYKYTKIWIHIAAIALAEVIQNCHIIPTKINIIAVLNWFLYIKRYQELASFAICIILKMWWNQLPTKDKCFLYKSRTYFPRCIFINFSVSISNSQYLGILQIVMRDYDNYDLVFRRKLYIDIQ